MTSDEGTEAMARAVRNVALDEGVDVEELDIEGNVLPTIGRIVVYTSKIDNRPGNEVISPAVVIRTRKTSVPAVIDRWGPEPQEVGPSPVDGKTHKTTSRPEGVQRELPDDLTVDLLVHGLGKDYREYTVEHSPDGALGTWNWPRRGGG